MFGSVKDFLQIFCFLLVLLYASCNYKSDSLEFFVILVVAFVGGFLIGEAQNRGWI